MTFLLLVLENLKEHHKDTDYVVHFPIYMYFIIMMRINAFLIVLLARVLYMMLLRETLDPDIS